MLPPTIQISEILWVATVIPGLLVWLRNAWVAYKSRRAVTSLGITDGRLLWARYSQFHTATSVMIETAFLAVGIMAMLSPPNPFAPSGRGWIIAGIFIFVSASISFKGLMWDQVDRALVNRARQEWNR